MGKISIFIILVFLAVLGLFAVENTDVVTFKVPFGHVYETSKIALILLSSVSGALFVLLYFFVRDTKRAIGTMQSQKRQKKEARIQEYYSKALNAFLGNKDEEARGALQEVLKEDSEHIDALIRLGDIASRRGDYSAALGFYKNARDIDPRNLRALLSMEDAYEKSGNDDMALKILDEILDIDGNNLTALHKKQAILEKKEKWDDLLLLHRAIAKLVHNDKDKQVEERKHLGYKYEYGRAGLENGDIEKAEKAFRTLLKIEPSFLPACLGLAEIMMAKGETEEAINFLEKSYGTMFSPIILARLEDLLINVDEPGRLLRLYKNAVSRSPGDNGLKFLMGKLYARLEMVDDAIETLESIDTNVYSTTELYALKGELYKKRYQVGRAMEEFRKAAELCSSAGMPYRCGNCGFSSAEWSGRCSSCGQWNTFALAV